MDNSLYMFDKLSPEQQELILAHLSLVVKNNQTTNITRITDLKEAQLLHIEDSLVGLDELQKAPAGRYADLGSGGGYPGIPLAIASGRATVLVESIKKKADILQKMANDLGISNQVNVFAGRVEELAKSEPGSFSVLTARALTSLPSLLELASPLLKKNGQLVCYKSQSVEDELAAVDSIQGKLGMWLLSDRAVDLDGKARRILVFEKRNNPQVSLPRRSGMAQKRPYNK